MFKNKQSWMQIHLYLSLFFLPAAFIYALTGSLYLLNIREEAGANITEIPIHPLTSGSEKEEIIEILQKNNLRIPNNTELRHVRGNLNMGSISYSITATKNKDGDFILRVVDRSLYGILLLMHKGKGAFYFDIIAIAFSIALMIFYLSGLIITAFCNKRRKGAIFAFLSGLFITACMIFLSI